MPKRLYLVSVSREAYVIAEDAEDAADFADDIDDDVDHHTAVIEIRRNPPAAHFGQLVYHDGEDDITLQQAINLTIRS